jgi:hypothetical protein
VSRDHVVADPRRIKKVVDFPFPINRKAMRAFLGLVNSLRRVTSLSVIEQIAILTPLTSSKVEYEPTEEHKRAFEHVKSLLTKQPLFNNLIDEKAEKFLWVDASTSGAVLGGGVGSKD